MPYAVEAAVLSSSEAAFRFFAASKTPAVSAPRCASAPCIPFTVMEFAARPPLRAPLVRDSDLPASSCSCASRASSSASSLAISFFALSIFCHMLVTRLQRGYTISGEPTFFV